MTLRSACIFALTILLLVAGQQPSVAETTLTPPLPHPAVVMVIAQNKETGSHQQATGFFVNQAGDVVTNYHAIAGAGSIFIRLEGGNQGGYPVTRVVRTDIPADLAILAVSIPGHSVHPVSLASRLPAAGEAIAMIGYPFGRRQTGSEGVIVSLFPVPIIDTLLGFTAPLTAGGSGSPLFNGAGEVVGIASFILYLGPNKVPHAFAIPATRLLRLQGLWSRPGPDR